MRDNDKGSNALMLLPVVLTRFLHGDIKNILRSLKFFHDLM